MKVVVIGDIHGRDNWKQLLNDVDKYDKIIFVGDYVDSFDVPNPVILQNLQEIIQFRRQFPHKVVTLLGNHDIQYLFWDEVRTFGCTGFRPEAAHDLITLFRANHDIFDAAWQSDKTIVTHAGITNGWMKYNKEVIESARKRFNTETIAETLNSMLHVHTYNRSLHQVSSKRGGPYNYGGITWADKLETEKDCLKGYTQVVGHTPVEDITTVKWEEDNSQITYCDVLWYKTSFYEFIIN